MWQVCLVARKGNKRHPGVREDQILDMIFSERLGQSQKPEEIYCMVESVFPGGAPPAPADILSHRTTHCTDSQTTVSAGLCCCLPCPCFWWCCTCES